MLIAIVGNMIARTTTVGAIVAIAYWIFSSGFAKLTLNKDNLRIWKYVILTLSILVPVVVYFYNMDKQFHDNIRFAFEGFFSIVETGKWETNSNNILKNMIVFPDNLKTWLIGDGYIENPTFRDPYYVGPNYGGY